MAFPLTLVLVASAFKDWFEDKKRKESDFEENNRKVLTADVEQRLFKPGVWENLKVGQVIKILRD